MANNQLLVPRDPVADGNMRMRRFTETVSSILNGLILKGALGQGPNGGWNLLAVAPGIMAPYAGAGNPPGWLPCDGASYPKAAYPQLFAVIGYTYGGSGANFSVPNLVGHSP